MKTHAEAARRALGAGSQHEWKLETENLARCQRCGRHLLYTQDAGRAPAACAPTPAWLRDHPEDRSQEA